MKSSTSILVKMPIGRSSSVIRMTGASKNLGSTSSRKAFDVKRGALVLLVDFIENLDPYNYCFH
jgi:hypothetical protein